MTSLKQIKDRLQSVQMIQKITKAMYLVSSAKIRRSGEHFKNAVQYYHEVKKVIYNLFVDNNKNLNPFSKKKKEPKSRLVIVITSNHGLAGPYNSSILKLAHTEMKNDDHLIVVGEKGISHFENNKFKILKTFSDVEDMPNYDDVYKISELIITQLLQSKIYEIRVIYTKFINPLSLLAVSEKIFPLETKKTVDKYKEQLFEFEPSAETIFLKIVPLYIAAKIYKIIVESKHAEMYSRRNAMEKATDNANEIIDNLELKYNRQRQAKITQEIIEISSGSKG